MKSIYVKFLDIVKDELSSEFLKKGMTDVITYVNKLESDYAKIQSGTTARSTQPELKMFGEVE